MGLTSSAHLTSGKGRTDSLRTLCSLLPLDAVLSPGPQFPSQNVFLTKAGSNRASRAMIRHSPLRSWTGSTSLAGGAFQSHPSRGTGMLFNHPGKSAASLGSALLPPLGFRLTSLGLVRKNQVGVVRPPLLEMEQRGRTLGGGQR